MGVPALQFARFIIVGVLNTLVTLAVIFLCKSLLGINPWVANAAGYVAGVINSFLWSKQWVFNSNGSWHREAVKFGVGFGLCYLLQFAVTWGLTEYTPLSTLLVEIGGFTLSGYGIATLLGMGIYTIVFFIYNRLIAFK